MRAMLKVAVGAALCFTLFGCDQNRQAQTVTATPVAIAPPPPCNCQQAAAAPVVRITHRHRGHHHGHTLSEFLAYSTGASYSANESRSVREYRPGDEERYAESEHAEMQSMTAENHRDAGAGARVWVDGYGNRHYADGGPLDDEHPGLISRKDEHERMRPWRGYDSKCNNGID